MTAKNSSMRTVVSCSLTGGNCFLSADFRGTWSGFAGLGFEESDVAEGRRGKGGILSFGSGRELVDARDCWREWYGSREERICVGELVLP